MDTDDQRNSPFADTSGKLFTSALYAVLKSRGAKAGSANSAFWRTCAPPRVQFFGWLLVHGWVQCETSLLQRKVVQDSTCELCNREPETASHLIFHCAFAASFWQTLGFQLLATLGVQDIPQLPRPDTIPATHFDTFVLLCCWQLWKRRNGIIFRQETMSLRQTMSLFSFSNLLNLL
jgi:hypothetical protein